TLADLDTAVDQLGDKVITEVKIALQSVTYARALHHTAELAQLASWRLIESLYKDSGYSFVRIDTRLKKHQDLIETLRGNPSLSHLLDGNPDELEVLNK